MLLLPIAAAVGFISASHSLLTRTVCVIVLLIFYLFLYIFYTRVFRWIQEVHTTSFDLRPNRIKPILEQGLTQSGIHIKKRRIGFLLHLLDFGYATYYDLGNQEAILEVAQTVGYSRRSISTRLSIGRRWNSSKEFSERVMLLIEKLPLPDGQELNPSFERRISKLFDLHEKATFGISLSIAIAVILTLLNFIAEYFGHPDNPYILIIFLMVVLFCMAPVTILEAMIAKLAWEH
jgi:hypothetical protein